MMTMMIKMEKREATTKKLIFIFPLSLFLRSEKLRFTNTKKSQKS